MNNETKKSDDIPATKKMLEETRDELKSSITSVKLDISSVRQEMKSGFDGIRSEIKELTAAVHRSLALHEEQNARNKYVLDGYQSIHDRQDQLESETREDIAAVKTVIAKLNTTN